MKHELTIGFVSQFSPEDKQACSGTNHAIAKSLGKIGNVVWCPLTMPPLYRPACLIAKLLCRTFGKTLLPEYTTWGAKWLSKGFDYNNASKCDVLFFSFCGSRIMNMKRINQPSLYLSDATLVSMIGYYDYFSHMPAFNVKQGVEIEKGSLDCCDQLIFSSDWAARSAINDLGQSPKKVNVIEFGANLDENDIRPKNFGCKQNLNILFMGVDWIRKGGGKTLDAVCWLNEHGVKTRLTIVGIRNIDEKVARLPYVENIGFLNKNHKDEYRKLVSIINQSDLLLLPTMAECSAISFAEASAYGLPIFTHDTGGVSNYIINGRNGYMLSLDSTGGEFGKRIKDCLENGELEKMTHEARVVYEERLNWKVWQQKVATIIHNLTSEKRCNT